MLISVCNGTLHIRVRVPSTGAVRQDGSILEGPTRYSIDPRQLNTATILGAEQKSASPPRSEAGWWSAGDQPRYQHDAPGTSLAPRGRLLLAMVWSGCSRDAMHHRWFRFGRTRRDDFDFVFGDGAYTITYQRKRRGVFQPDVRVLQNESTVQNIARLPGTVIGILFTSPISRLGGIAWGDLRLEAVSIPQPRLDALLATHEFARGDSRANAIP